MVSGRRSDRAAIARALTAWKLTMLVFNESNKQVGWNMAFWLSNDARRPPVELQADLAVGSFVMALREAR